MPLLGVCEIYFRLWVSRAATWRRRGSEAEFDMLAIDRSWDDPEGPHDGRKLGHSGQSPARGLAHANADTREAITEAYRDKVDAAYARAAMHAKGESTPPGDDKSADSPEATRPDFAERYPNRYTRTDDPLPRIDRPGEHPSRWIADIYPARERRVRPNNCGECARAVDNTWHGDPTAASELANLKLGGERPAVMREWAGQAPEPASMSEVERRLRELGPGSSAVVGFDRDNAPGHWFNAVNHEGTVLAVDGQGGRFEEWPPSNDGLGFDESGMSYSDALFFTVDGKVVPSDHQ
jgi:hypothetical protein